MENKRVFVVLSAAIPKSQKMNTLATKVSATCLRASRADAVAKFITESQADTVVYGLDCAILTSVVDTELNGEIIDGDQNIFIVVAAAIPVRKGMDPVQSRVHSAWTDKTRAEITFQKMVSKKDINVKNIPCDIHASIIEIKLDKS